MARKKATQGTEATFEVPAVVIKDVDIVDEIEEMFVPFAHYTIADRAIPDVKDGLKPSQRRILWAMQYDGFTSKKPFVKSSRVVGSVLASWHPHGDASVYSTMANMVKPYILNVPLVEGKGSFGFIAGDTESASRYTEARMQPISDRFMDDIKFNAVPMQPNFDERLEEPVVLPVMFPLLPINGASGIAVGFATNCAPHNPDEVIDATIALINNPKMTVDDLMKILPGPDFPTGCDIIGIDGIRDAYMTGKGIVKQRAKYRIMDAPRGRHIVEFYEIPYNISPTKVIADINKLRANETLVGVTDVMDLMDKNNPVRIAMYVKSGVNAEAVAEVAIDKSPSLYCTFAFNQTALLNNVPRVFPMIDMLQNFIDFRRDVIERRTKAQIEKLKSDKSLQEALAAVLLDIDKVIEIVRNSDTNEQVYTKLRKEFGLNLEQAKYIGDMRLIQLKRKDKLEVDKKIKALEKELKRLQSIIKTKASLSKEVIAELLVAKDMISHPRKSVIIKKTVEEYEAKKNKGGSKEVNAATFSVSGSTTAYLNPDGKVYRDEKKRMGWVQKIPDLDLNATVLLVFEDGDSLRIPAHELPAKAAIAKKKCAGIIIMATGEELVSMVTDDGKVKVLQCSTLTKAVECPVMAVSKGAKVTSARPYDPEHHFIFINTEGQLVHFPCSQVNSQGRTSAGMAGAKLPAGTKALFAGSLSENAMIVSSKGDDLKVTALADIRTMNRGTAGTKFHKMKKGEKMVMATVAENPNGSRTKLPKKSAVLDGGSKLEGSMPTITEQ